MIKRLSLLLTLVGLLLLVAPVQAQTPDPQTTPTPSRTGEIQGRVINQTSGSALPSELTVMLHVWDQNFAELIMRDSPMQADGSFTFNDVPFATDLIYGLMTTYNDVLYFAEPISPASEETTLNVEIPIAEITTDTSHIEISRAHLLFAATKQRLQVTEVLSVSNLGERTIKDAVDLAAGGKATLTFPTPADATNLVFRDASERWVVTPDGFADTDPLPPGENVDQIIVSYEVPYQDGMTFTYQTDYPTLGVTLVLADNAGISIKAEGMTDAGARTTTTGKRLHMYDAPGMPAGGTLKLQLSGQPQASAPQNPSANMSEPYSPTQINQATLIGLFTLAAALIITGLWWRRRLQQEASLPDPTSIPMDELIQEIALLDEAHEQGTYNDSEYQSRRSALMEQIRRTLIQDETTGEPLVNAPTETDPA